MYPTTNVKFGKLCGIPKVRFNFKSAIGRDYTATVLQLAKGYRVESITNATTGSPVARVTFEAHKRLAANLAESLFVNGGQ